MKTIITVSVIFLALSFVFAAAETHFANLSNVKTEEPVEAQMEQEALAESEQIASKAHPTEQKDESKQNNSIITENISEPTEDLCEKNCVIDEPICNNQECNDNNTTEDTTCEPVACVVYLPICSENTCVEVIEEKEQLYIPNNAEQCIDLFYDINLASQSMIEFESENDIMSTYRGLCNELVNFKPTSYDEFINNRPVDFPPMPIKVDQLGKYLFDTYLVLYSETL